MAEIACAAACLLWMTAGLHAQTPQEYTGILFYQLNTTHGLSDNYTYDMAIDSSGNLWIATGDGLNMFNGKTVVRFFASEYPELKSNNCRQVICDSRNRIWVKSGEGHVSMIDEERTFHAISVQHENKEIPVRRILYTASAGIIMFTSNGHFLFPTDRNVAEEDSFTLNDFIHLPVAGFDSLYAKGFHQVEPFDTESYLFVLPQKFYKINYVTQKVEKEYNIPMITVLCQWNDSSVLVSERETRRLKTINLYTEAIDYPFAGVTDQHGRTITAQITNAERTGQQEYVLTTFKSGMYAYKAPSGKLTHHKHHIADPTSIANNNPTVITKNKQGWVFLGVLPHGVSYYKSDAVVGQQTFFQDESGYGFDGYINTIVTQDNDTYYIGTTDHLIKWRRSVNATEFLLYDENAEDAPVGPGIYYLAFDQQNRLWLSTLDNGIYILDLRSGHLVTHIRNTPGTLSVLPSNNTLSMRLGPDGWMWLSTSRGVCRINTRTLEIDLFKNEPLSQLNGLYCYMNWFADPENVWIGTSNAGAWHYHIPSGSITNYNKENSSLDNQVYCFNADTSNNIYIGTANGLFVMMRDGSTKHIGTEQGLLNSRVEALLRDRKNRMWIGNDVALACYNIADTSLRVFDERYGLSVYGFRVSAYHQNSDDELIWGTERGIQYFYPDKLYDQKVRVSTTINRIESRDIARNLTQNTFLALSPADNNITFYFTSIDYSTHLRTFYQYQLEGLDEEWIDAVDQTSVRYSAVPPGTYTFKVRASNDGKTWVEASNTATIEIASPFWQQPWFILLGLTAVGIGIWKVIQFYRQKNLKRQQELETQIVINYFASRINSYRKTEDLLWDVARNCISKLHFEDCVIYLLDDQRNLLVQKAAYGPKAGEPVDAGRPDLAISQPLDIPVGTGIVGSVARSGKAELIPDTTLDKRYIVDDVRRHAELTVPMIVDDKVIGVIDSEHSRKHFFTQRHMNILSTIATLCANQIQRVRAEEEKQQAMIEVLKNKQKVTESRLQSLRLQMNPHFLFNALNSIQQMILANEEMVATRYLSRFSKLLRTILIHSDKEMVTLKEELDILRLYVDLESVRFKDAFQYSIDCDEEIDIDEVKIPTLLIQPFVENAIWHGLMHKEGDRHLTVNFFEKDDRLHCIIEDNGIGREKAQELKLTSGHGKDHTSKGIAVSVERLKTMSGGNGHGGSMDIIDLRDASGKAAGTRVEIRMPMQN